MSPFILITFLLSYFGIIFLISHFVAKKNSSNESFFVANRNSKWYLVAFGMIGTTLSGLTFISVPGNVSTDNFFYFQFVLGNAVGFAVVIFVLLPLYYKLSVSSIYLYLGIRFGKHTQKIGSVLFLFSRIIGSSIRLYLIVIVLQRFIFDSFNIPFELSVFICIGFIWLYTYKGGLKTIIITDSIQTFFFLSALVITITVLYHFFNMPMIDLIKNLHQQTSTTIFNFNNFLYNKTHFIKQFIGGALLVIATVGLDQDLMQKNLSLKNVKEAKKNMLVFTTLFLIVNFLFLCVGALLKMYVVAKGIDYGGKTDYIYPTIALNHLGFYGAMVFLLGLTASTFSTTDSALTALTTSFCIDVLGFEDNNNHLQKNLTTRKLVHTGFALLILIITIIFHHFNNEALIKIVFILGAYTYGPLFALYCIGLYSTIKLKEKYVFAACIISPMACYCIDFLLKTYHIYYFGVDVFILNAILTMFGLWLIRDKK